VFTIISQVFGWEDWVLHQSSDWLEKLSPKRPIMYWVGCETLLYSR